VRCANSDEDNRGAHDSNRVDLGAHISSGAPEHHRDLFVTHTQVAPSSTALRVRRRLTTPPRMADCLGAHSGLAFALPLCVPAASVRDTSRTSRFFLICRHVLSGCVCRDDARHDARCRRPAQCSPSCLPQASVRSQGRRLWRAPVGSELRDSSLICASSFGLRPGLSKKVYVLLMKHAVGACLSPWFKI
jgi:hypothetical protein